MPRLNVVDPANATGKVKEIFDGPLKGKHLNIFKGLANSAAALDAYLSFSGSLKGGALTDAEREVVALAVGEANGCGYCVAAHTVIGKGAGLSEDQTVAARRGQLDDPKLNAVARFALALHEKRGNASQEDLDAFRAAGYDDGHITEVIGAYALSTFTNFFNHVNDSAIDFPAPPSLG